MQDIALSAFTSGWVNYTFTISSLLDQSDLDWINNNYYSWRLESFSASIRIVGYKNFFRKADTGSALTNIAYKDAGNTALNNPTHIAFFRQSTQYTDTVALDPESKYTRIMETGCVQRPKLGRPGTFKWLNATAYKGVYVDTGASINTSIPVAFIGSLPTSNEPYGYGIILMERGNFLNVNATGDNQAILRVQMICNGVIRLRNKKPLA